MELKSSILSRLKLFVVGCFSVFLILLYFIDNIQQNTNISSAKNQILDFEPLVSLLDPNITQISSSIVEVSSFNLDININISNNNNINNNSSNINNNNNNYANNNDNNNSNTNNNNYANNNDNNNSNTNNNYANNNNNINNNNSNNNKNNDNDNDNNNNIILEELPTKKDDTKCDIFNGKWVYKEEEEPMYNTKTCPFLEVGVTCQSNGRPDFDYVKWRWEATDCDIPLLNGKDMLERLKNKRMIIVGDSINRNMWESLACLLYSSIPSSSAEVVEMAAYRMLKAKNYNFTLEFYMSPFLVEVNKKHKSGRRVLILDRISSFSKQWEGAHIMLFNSAHWWTHGDAIKGWDLFSYKGKLVEDLPRDIAYKRGMRTWASWINKNINPTKTSVYFRSVSPSHFNPHFCYNATQPIMDESYTLRFPTSLINVIENITKKMNKLGVKYMNITKLSEYRMDAHPSIYTTKIQNNGKALAPDCSHWCLPGLPDTWNRLLYASILLDSLKKFPTS